MKRIFMAILMAIPVYTSGYSQSIAAGSNHSLMICKGNKNEIGDVYSWGFNWYGQLSQSNNSGALTPTMVNITHVSMVDAGAMHTLFLKSDGTLWASGGNSSGQLGTGDTLDTNMAVLVTGISNVKSVSAGWEHSVALKNDSTVWCWGNNQFGQLGLGDQVNRNIPVQVPGLTRVKMIATGRNHSLAIRYDGTVWVWGWNSLGQLGNNSTVNSLSPIQVNGLSGIIAIAGGDWHSLALKNNGTVWAWGSNTYGQLGKGTNNWSDSTASVVNTLSSVTHIDAGRFYSMALKSDGTLFTWGMNSYGVLGNGSTTDQNLPMQVPGLTNVTRIAAGGEHALALRSNGTLWAWGLNGNGQVGDGNFATQSTSPVLINSPCAVNNMGIEDPASAELTIFPNPTSHVLFIEYSANGNAVLEMYDMQGKSILTTQLQPGITQLDISSVSKGVYLVRINGTSKKLVIN